MKHYAVPTAYHSEDDNETSAIYVHFVSAETPDEAKILTRDIVIKEELELDPDNHEVSEIWFENPVEGVPQGAVGEGIIIGEPQEIPQTLKPQPRNGTHPDGSTSDLPYSIRQRLAGLEEEALNLVADITDIELSDATDEEYYNSDSLQEFVEEFEEKVNDLQSTITKIQEKEGWI